ncbi:GGDEF domain-containing protein [Vreelandella olivaria]|uniref:GGDEF domain-containing protein n=1 Tax=Vreelandella olivaria TaxID=390919 RepID=UPI00201E8D28|nr:GGDEF domain-containing protein [Halomonas olivaria]
MQAPDTTNSSLPTAKLPWYRTLIGKVALFMLLGVMFAYFIGAMLGFVMVERGAREQWGREAQVNAQIVSAVIRRIYTSVAVRTDNTGQVTHIVSPKPIGDEDSVLATGFSPIDVLALASAQTRHNVWLFSITSEGEFKLVADALHSSSNPDTLEVADWKTIDEADNLYVGFAHIGQEEYFVSSLPIITPEDQLLGVVISTIGLRQVLYQMREELIYRAFFYLLLVLMATALLISILMRQLFRPVPKLIHALTQIAHNQTENVTPYTSRGDEIGSMSQAIEALRKKVVEREHLLEVKEEALRYQHLAHHDVLTKLPNRVQFNDALQTAVDSLPEGNIFNVMIFDLDRFKAVNDNLGHAVGDELLVAVSQRVQQLLSDNELVARLGGDEFSIIQYVQRNAIEEAEALASQIVVTLRQPFTIEGHDIHIGVSVGIAQAPRDGESSHTLLRSADVALYAAKALGRGRYKVFAAGMTMGGRPKQ